MIITKQKLIGGVLGGVCLAIIFGIIHENTKVTCSDFKDESYVHTIKYLQDQADFAPQRNLIKILKVDSIEHTNTKNFLSCTMAYTVKKGSKDSYMMSHNVKAQKLDNSSMYLLTFGRF